MNLRWKLRRGSGRLVVEMLGDFDETADLRDLVTVLRGRIAIDLGGVRRFSSAGVREWIHFVRSLPQGTDLSLVGCSTASVTQLNLIDNFRGHARVESFWAPYACVACGAECEVLLEDRSSDAPAASAAAAPASANAVPARPVGDSTAAFPIAAGSQAIPVLGSSASITPPPLDDTAGIPAAVDSDDDSGVVIDALSASSTTTGPIALGAVARALPSPPPVHCDSCGHSMVLDELPQHYLLFLADRPVRLAERGRN